jgi:hypothetical protein
MFRHLSAALAMTVLAAVTLSLTAPAPAEAGSGKRYAGKYTKSYAKSANRRYRRSPQVRGYISRGGGGYSFNASDTVNTTASSGRTVYGGMNTYRDFRLGQQTTSGPFDHGFFFNSASMPRGGDSPYHQ